jgi:hypothetical protein
MAHLEWIAVFTYHSECLSYYLMHCCCTVLQEAAAAAAQAVHDIQAAAAASTAALQQELAAARTDAATHKATADSAHTAEQTLRSELAAVKAQSEVGHCCYTVCMIEP